MKTETSHSPRPVHQVMVSSTFTDLKEHRAALIKALNEHNLHPSVMEYDSAKPDGDVIDSSLQIVRDSAAYILVISLKYGQTPECATRNPDRLSITELEFNEAQRLNRPTLLYVMGEDHGVKKADIEHDAEKEKKLNAFRDRAKIDPVSKVNRVYAVFESLEDFKDKLPSSLHALCNHLKDTTEPSVPNLAVPQTDTGLPKPPAFYASPDYIGRTNFIGRKAQLKTLSDWAQPGDRTSVLLFEAIGGNGKSMLTWHWAKDESGEHATVCRPANSPWAGRFWYSFYEKGAIMRDFCQHALAYMTQQPLEAFEKKSTPEMRVALMAELHKKPWLLILDGLERVLVAYHRIDAAEVRDEDLNRPTDKILNRDPCDAIRDEDTDLLRALAKAEPSKILISSRLIPRALLNPAGLPLPGVRPLVLPGLDEADAEALLHSCGVQGTSADIRYYLTNYCGNHPLVIGVLAGLINSPGPHRGNFDGWAADPNCGAKLNLASLDLIQSRNHILLAAMDALEPTSRQLLCTLALLSNAVDYDTVAAFNPHTPPEPMKLAETMQDLERRGLVQYDSRTQRYDLHPVVRGVAAGGMKAEDRERYGLKVVDHFNAQPHPPYDKARTMEDVSSGLHVVRTLLKLGHQQQAADAYMGDLSFALVINLEGHVEVLSLLRPFFPAGWDQLPKDVRATTASYLANEAAIALSYCGERKHAIDAYAAALLVELENENWAAARVRLSNISLTLSAQNRLAESLRACSLALDFAGAHENKQSTFISRLVLFTKQSRLGQWREAEATWQQLDLMGRLWSRAIYRQGYAEELFAWFQFWQGRLQEEQINSAATLAEQDHNRTTLRHLHRLRGEWRLDQREWALAATSFTQAVTMAREVRLVDEGSETGLALAKVHLGQLTGDEARSETQRHALRRFISHRYLSLIWQAIGDLDQAKRHALAAYSWAWADGEPYVNRYELTKTTELLHELGVPIPNLPPYDPAKDEPFPWEADVRAAIEKLRAEKEAKKDKDSKDDAQ